MPDEVKKPESGISPCAECNRRRFAKIGVGSIAVAGAGSAVFGYEFLSPNVLYEPSPIVDAGKPDRYPPDSVTPDPQSGIYIVHGAARHLYAFGGVHAPRVPHGVETGAGHYRVPVPRQQVPHRWSQDSKARLRALCPG